MYGKDHTRVVLVFYLILWQRELDKAKWVLLRLTHEFRFLLDGTRLLRYRFLDTWTFPPQASNVGIFESLLKSYIVGEKLSF